MRTIGGYWGAAAGDSDREPDHGLGRREVRDAWAARLAAWVPGAPCDVVDIAARAGRCRGWAG